MIFQPTKTETSKTPLRLNPFKLRHFLSMCLFSAECITMSLVELCNRGYVPDWIFPPVSPLRDWSLLSPSLRPQLGWVWGAKWGRSHWNAHIEDTRVFTYDAPYSVDTSSVLPSFCFWGVIWIRKGTALQVHHYNSYLWTEKPRIPQVLTLYFSTQKVSSGHALWNLATQWPSYQ